MEETSVARAGPIEGTSRVLRELLRTQRFKKSMNILLSELDPENTAILVRTLIWEDPEFFLSLLGALPDIINVLIEGLLESGRQFGNFPPGLLSSFSAGMATEVDAEHLGQSIGVMLLLVRTISESDTSALDEAWVDFAARFRRGITSSLSEGNWEGESASGLLLEMLVPSVGTFAQKVGREAARDGSETSALVKGMADGIRAIAFENPEFIDSVVAPLVEAVRKALAGASKAGMTEGEGD